MAHIDKKIEKLGDWVHLIELAEGAYTIPKCDWAKKKDIIAKQHYIARTLLPFMRKINRKKQSDTTVLDLGCMDGWLTFLLQKDGYKHIAGIGSSLSDIERANFVKEVMSVNNVDFILTLKTWSSGPGQRYSALPEI